MLTEAIVLVGGLGTRLRQLIPDIPKPLAPIKGRPFLSYVLEYLVRNGIQHAILAVGYRAEQIQEYCGDNYRGMKISYSLELTPLGTGGAMKKASTLSAGTDILVVNGDTIFDVEVQSMSDFHREIGGRLTMAVKEVHDTGRYGSVVVSSNRAVAFCEKGLSCSGKINGGIYIIDSSLFENITEDTFSFEKRILESGLFEINVYESAAYFIDIGVEEDYRKAQEELGAMMGTYARE